MSKYRHVAGSALALALALAWHDMHGTGKVKPWIELDSALIPLLKRRTGTERELNSLRSDFWMSSFSICEKS